MLIGTLPTTHLQILCKIYFNFHVIAKSILDPDDNLNGLNVSTVCEHNCPVPVLFTFHSSSHLPAWRGRD